MDSKISRIPEPYPVPDGPYMGHPKPSVKQPDDAAHPNCGGRIGVEPAAGSLDTALQKHWPCTLISRQAFHHNSAMPVAAVEPIVYAD
jgi:hypothetical protein